MSINWIYPLFFMLTEVTMRLFYISITDKPEQLSVWFCHCVISHEELTITVTTAPAQFLTFPCTSSTHGWLFTCVYASPQKHLENAPGALQKRKRKRQRECRLKEFIFTSLTWDCWFFFIHSICPLISLTLYLPPSPFISCLSVCLSLVNSLLGKAKG